MYLIEILHQTTTQQGSDPHVVRLYLIEILHQTTTATCDIRNPYCCILSKFYIKPQLIVRAAAVPGVVSYRNSTSNHNVSRLIIWIIKVVSYRNSTSNHNNATMSGGSASLYLIEILHQTTTEDRRHLSRTGLYLIEILHQTTTSSTFSWLSARCILSKFYIKPQLQNRRISISSVVSYRNSTSNHNIAFNDMLGRRLYLIEILHQTTTRCKTSNCR